MDTHVRYRTIFDNLQEQKIYIFTDNYLDNQRNEQRKIEDIIKKYQIQTQVELTGTLSREETAKRVMDADSLICFSRLETFGVPVIEAWACGLPVVASDCLGFLEYWNEELGYIVSHKSIEELQNAMKKIWEQRDTYHAEKISKFAVEHFGEEAVYGQLMDIYTSLRSHGSFYDGEERT